MAAKSRTQIHHTSAAAARTRGPRLRRAAFQRPWGFDPREISMPVHLFHGTSDRVVPQRDAQYWIDTLADCRVHSYEGQGHFLIEDRFEDVLRAVLGATT